MKKMCLVFIANLLIIFSVSAGQGHGSMKSNNEDDLVVDAANAMNACISTVLMKYDDHISDAKTIAMAVPDLIEHDTFLPSFTVKERYCKGSRDPDKCESLFWSVEFPKLSNNNYRRLVVDVLFERSLRRPSMEMRDKH